MRAFFGSEETTRLWQFFRDLSGNGSGLPGLEQLQQILEVAFWASLEKEEARPVQFCLLFDSRPQEGLLFEEALPLNVHSIVKLAPALVMAQTAMGITSENGETVIWGTAALPTQALTVESDEPGQLRLRFLDRTRVVIRSGQIIYLAHDNSDNLLFLVNSVSEYDLKITPFFLLLSEALEKIIQAMLEQGHGGTLLWIPNARDWSAGVKSIRYRCQPANAGLRQAIDSLYPDGPPGFTADYPENYRKDPEYKVLSRKLHSIQSVIASVGQLTAVDGATVINEDLLVLAFGVMLRAQANDGQDEVRILELGAAQQGPVKLEDLPSLRLAQLGGARHRSAAEFCLRHPESLAFVASQDGSLTILGCGCKSGLLFAIRRAELALQ